MRAILTYHSIDASRSPISVDAAAFRRHVVWLASSAVSVVPLERLLDVPDGGHAIAITFDDAFRSFIDVAWPLLREHRLPVTVFVPTAHVGGENAWDAPGGPVPRFRIADWDALARAAEEGATLGAHTRTHPDLRRVSQDALADELTGSAERVRAETGRACRAFAYPFGRLDERVVAAARPVFDLACTADLRTLRSGDEPLRLPRLDAYYFRDNDWLMRFGSAPFQRRLWLRRRGRQVRSLAVSAGVLA